MPRASAPCLLLVAALGVMAPGCCLVRPPKARELLEVGLRRSPEQALRGFQTAMSANLPDEEFKSFSIQFRRANRLSLGTYVEARRRLFEEQPWLVLVADAEVASSERLGERHHRMVLSVPGDDLEVGLVREDFFEMWAEDELLADGLIDFEGALRSAGSTRLLADLAEEAGVEVDLARVTELRLGQEWKIDAIGRQANGQEGMTP